MKRLVGKNFNVVVLDKEKDVFVMFCKYLHGDHERLRAPLLLFQ